MLYTAAAFRLEAVDEENRHEAQMTCSFFKCVKASPDIDHEEAEDTKDPQVSHKPKGSQDVLLLPRLESLLKGGWDACFSILCSHMLASSLILNPK